MTTNPRPMGQLERELLRSIDDLHHRLLALTRSAETTPPLNTPEKKAVALKKGLRKLHRAAHYARLTGASTALPLVHELRRIARSIDHEGLDGQMADLHRIVGAAVALDAETGAPVARRLAEAAARFEGVFAPQGLSPVQWARRSLWKRRHVPRSSIRREKRPSE
jgi:hypothetical protein